MMFAPPAAKARTTVAANANRQLPVERSMLVGRSFDSASAEQANQLPLQLGDNGISWDLTKVPPFPPERDTSAYAPAAVIAVPFIQPKLVVGAVDDPLESEADRVADQVMRTGAPLPAISAARPQLTHAIPQPSALAAGRPAYLQRQAIGTTVSDDEKDPDCPANAPYRWGPKRGPDGAEPAVVSPCMPTPMPRSQGKVLSGEIDADQAPSDSPTQASPTAPSTQSDQQTTTTGDTVTPTPAADAGAGDQPAGSDGEPFDFDDDPLAEGGFGPNDTSIRVRPGPVRTTLIRPTPDLTCSYDMRQIAAFGGTPAAADLAQLATNITTAFTGCAIAYVSIDVMPRASEDDPNGNAIARRSDQRPAHAGDGNIR